VQIAYCAGKKSGEEIECIKNGGLDVVLKRILKLCIRKGAEPIFYTPLSHLATTTSHDFFN
jgi:hypothetical protein